MKISASIFFIATALATPIVDVDKHLLEPQAMPPLDPITVLSAATSGNGCPAGTVSTTFSPDKTVVTFGFDAFQAYIGPSTRPQEHSKNCQIHLSLKYPSGIQFSVMEATYHGYARMDAGVNGTFVSTYYFSQNAANTASSKTTINGPSFLSGQIYTKVDTVENASVVWSPCGATGILNINNRIALTAPPGSTAAGELSDDDATVTFEQKMLFQWRNCTM